MKQGWDRADADEWATPAPPLVRFWVMAVAVVMIVLAAVIGVLGSVPGAANGATLLGLLLIVGGLTLAAREVRR